MDLSDFPPFDESVVGRALTLGAARKKVEIEAHYKAYLVRGNIPLESTPGMLDIEAVRRQARNTRAAWIGRKVQAVLLALEDWLEQRRQRELEAYLADSQNLADLEARMRRYTTQRTPFGVIGRDYD